ncbi:MAG TPA: precorrin-8X methylmutase, partial [Stellaceae bacterium]|nr:precorrin-8X methylmutase [Stellaceae bacterium]
MAEPRYDYLRDPDAIYRRSFALIRDAVDLAPVPRDLRAVALRLVHTCGDPSIVGDLIASPGAATRGRKALARGADILVDAAMVAAGIT